MIESLGSTRSTDERILDPDSELPLQINARLVREHHTCLKRRRVSADEGWLLVTIEAKPMADTVDEVLTVSSARNNISGCALNILTIYAKAQGVIRSLVGLENGIIDVTVLLGWFADMNRAGPA